jgi:ribosomal protein S18 acetylase RimI-like enzyme
MLRLQPMPHTDFEDFRATSLENYAKALSRNLRISFRRAGQMAVEELKNILPRGYFSDDHYFYNLVADIDEREVGKLWYYINRKLKSAFLYDLMIFDEFQRQGYGKEALLEMEKELKKKGIVVIRLNVFNDNRAARKLYSEQGYDNCNQILQKFLD